MCEEKKMISLTRDFIFAALLAKTIEEMRREGRKIMDEEALDKLTKQVEELSSDEEMIELEGVCSKQELAYEAQIEELSKQKLAFEEELSQQKLAHEEELSKQELAFETQIEELKETHAKEKSQERLTIIKNMLNNGMSNEEIEKLTGIGVSEQKVLLQTLIN